MRVVAEDEACTPGRDLERFFFPSTFRRIVFFYFLLIYFCFLLTLFFCCCCSFVRAPALHLYVCFCFPVT